MNYKQPDIPRDFRITKKMLRFFFAANGKPISSRRLKNDIFPETLIKELKLSKDSYKRVKRFGRNQTKIIIRFNQFDEDDIEELIELSQKKK